MDDVKKQFKEAITTLEQHNKQVQDFIKFCDENSEALFEDEKDWIVAKSELIQQSDTLIAELAKLDQIQAKYRK